MKENNQIKIKLTTAIVLILILLITIVVIYALMMSNNENQIEPEISKFEAEGSENSAYQSGDSTTENEPEKQQVEQSDFSINFLKLENNKQNMIYSPLSIKYALKMLNEGANGNTRGQIENLIGESNLSNYKNIDKVLSFANGLYIRNTYTKYVKEDYRKILIEKYNAEINYDSFSNADNINKWIENKTFGTIKNMVQDKLVQNLYTEMLLINALAIDMEWEKSFDAQYTTGKDFYLENGSTMNATTMNMNTNSDSVSYYKDENITALKMDLKKYDDTQLEFLAIMPEDNLSNYVETFSIDKLNNITKNLKLASETASDVKITIPRFSFDYDLKLKNDLMNLGITDAFDPSVADFTKISDTGLHVSDALHKANIDFTEKGIKAGATTVIIMKDLFAKAINELIEINKPFLYVIRDKNTNETWFVGTVYEPNSWETDKATYEYR